MVLLSSIYTEQMEVASMVIINLAGAGGFIHGDKKGNWKAGFTVNLGKARSILSEIWSL